MWPYRDAEGRLLGYAARVEFVGDDGKCHKDVLPIAYCRIGGERCGWRARALSAPRRLYRLPELIADPAAPVVVTEGEKKADLVPSLAAVVTEDVCHAGFYRAASDVGIPHVGFSHDLQEFRTGPIRFRNRLSRAEVRRKCRLATRLR